LEWSTEFETLEGEFVLERADIDQLTVSSALSVLYKPLVTIASRGSTTSGETYAFTDELYLEGNYRYRLLFTNASSHTRTLIAEFDANIPAPQSLAIVSVYPNPLSARAQIILDVPEALPVSAAFYDVLGRETGFITEMQMNAGRHFLPIDASNWSPGIYFVRIKAGSRILDRRMVVMH
jgi:hypothetical protein